MTLELCVLVTAGNSPGPLLEEVSISSAVKERTPCVRGVQQKCQQAKFRCAARGQEEETNSSCLHWVPVRPCASGIYFLCVGFGSWTWQGHALSTTVTLAPNYMCHTKPH